MNIVKWYKNRSFQFKLVIGYLVLALIPMLCVTWYSYGKTRNVLLTEAYQSAEQEAERIEKNFSTMVEPYETILEVLYVDQMLSGYLFQDYSNDSYEDMFYYIDKKLSEICLMNAGIYKICFYSNNETLPQDNYYFYSMQDLDRREGVLTFDAIGETVFCGTSGDGKAFHMNRLMNFYPQGGMKSVLSLQIENQQIQPLLDTINSTDEIYLVDQKGYILAASEPEMAGLPIRTRMPEEDLEQKAQIEFERDGISKIGNIQSGVFGTKILVISAAEDSSAISALPALLPQAKEPRLPEPGSRDAEQVQINFAPQSTTGFAYDAASGTYGMLRADGTAQLDANTGAQAQFDNLLVLYSASSLRDDGTTLDYDLSLGGGVWLNGSQLWHITWTQGTDSTFAFYDADGRPLTIRTGRSYIALVSSVTGQELTVLDSAGQNVLN